MYNSFQDIDDLPKHIFEEIKHFFSVYKMLEGKETSVEEVRHRDDAVKSIQKSIDLYNEKFGAKA